MFSKHESKKYGLRKVFDKPDTEAATRGILYKRDALNNFAKFTGKHLFRSFFFHKVAELRVSFSVLFNVTQYFKLQFSVSSKVAELRVSFSVLFNVTQYFKLQFSVSSLLKLQRRI